MSVASDTTVVVAGMSNALAHKIGAIRDGAIQGDGNADRPMPETQLDWAIHWAQRGLCVFPLKSFIGVPIPSAWYGAASTNIDVLIAAWAAVPAADIAAVPDKSGHFVLAAVGADGRASLRHLERSFGKLSPAFDTRTSCGSRHLWFEGRALTSRDRLGPGLRVYGPGTFVTLPPSLTPDVVE